jgi:hypothetical protein
MANPADLNITPQPDTDKNFFNFKAVGLKLNKTYAIKFQWIYEDGTLSNWSPGFAITTSNETAPAVPSSASVPGSATGSIPVTLSAFPTNAKRVDVVITNGIFGTATVAHSFTTAGTATIAAPAGTYIVQLRSVSPTGVTSTVGTTFTITIADAGETIQSPTNPNGFSSKRILAGIEVSWAGTYASSTFTGFEAINIYAGNSATATNGTYEQVGVLTGNNVKNTIVVPLGTYVAYGQAVYIHAAAVNKSGTVGTIQANVTNQTLGPGKATDADINDGAVVISKLASDVLTVGNLKAGDINATSYIRAGTKSTDGLSGARVEISSSTITQTGTNVLPGFYIYNSSGTAILSAPLSGGLSITGGGTFTGALSGASGSFTGSMAVGQGTVSTITGASGNGTKVTYTAFNSLEVGDVVTISGIANNGPFLTPGSDPATYYYTANTYNMSNVTVTDVTDTTFKVLSSVTSGGNQSYTSGGTVTGVAFTVSSTGNVKAYSGNIGGWRINSQAFKSSAVTYPSIQLDPVSSKIELRGSPGNSDTGNYIKMDTTSGLRIGSGSTPAFTVAMNGSLSATKVTLSNEITGGNKIILDDTSLRAIGTNGTVAIDYNGNVTLTSSGNSFGATSGSIITLTGTADSGILGEPSVVTSTTIGPGSMSLYQGSVFGSAAFSFYQYVYNNQLNYYATGLSEITWRNYYVNPGTFNFISSKVTTTGGDEFRPLGVDPFGGQYLGPRLFSGTAASNSTINTDINGRGYANSSLNGDFYFSTA